MPIRGACVSVAPLYTFAVPATGCERCTCMSLLPTYCTRRVQQHVRVFVPNHARQPT
jgi:hypothetical protein